MNTTPLPHPDEAVLTIRIALEHLRELSGSIPSDAVRDNLLQAVGRIAASGETVQLALTRLDFFLATLCDGLDDLICLLHELEDRAIPAGHLTGLIALLHRQAQVMHLLLCDGATEDLSADVMVTLSREVPLAAH